MTTKVYSVTKEIALTVNNTTDSIPIFKCYGICDLYFVEGIVTSAFSNNITNALLRVEDLTNSTPVSIATLGTASSMPVGAYIMNMATGVTKAFSSTLVASSSLSADNNKSIMHYYLNLVGPKTTEAYANLSFRYATTNTPSSGNISFTAWWSPVTPNARIVAI